MPAGELGPTIDGLLTVRAESHGDRAFLRFASGDLTFADVERRVARLAGGLAAAGVERGDLVPVLVPNSPEFVITWLALCRLGAVACLVNTAFKGPALAHALGATRATVLVEHESVRDHIDAVVGGLPVRPTRIDRARWAELADGPPVAAGAHRPVDPAMVLFTSGTTGPSKGCVLPHRYTIRQAELMIEHLAFRDDDVLYCPYPLFHIDATVLTIGPALVLGATAAIGERFSVTGFWPEVRRFGATVFDFMGATLTMLHKAPLSPDDGDNPVRLAWGVPVPDEFADAFERRFGLQLVELYGSTDAGVPIYHPVGVPRRPGSCGTLVAAYEARLVDDDGFEVADDVVGELLVRPAEPSLMADGYLGAPEATIAARRDLWFHTGDLLRRDADGFYSFVGRRTDSIRRRGENISAFEVEEVVKLHPDVLDAAAFGVPSELTEEDVMVAVVPRPGIALDPATLLAFCADRAARHMVPRYVDVVDDLPRTPTEKVRKEQLRARGVTASTFDAEAPATASGSNGR